MVKVNIHQHQKGKPNLSKKNFGPEATLIQCILMYLQSGSKVRPVALFYTVKAPTRG